jgi:hypothetical protein
MGAQALDRLGYDGVDLVGQAHHEDECFHIAVSDAAAAGTQDTADESRILESGPSIWPDLRSGLSVSDRESPRFTRVNGPLMARRLDHVRSRPSAQAWRNPSSQVMCRCGAAACRCQPLAAAAAVTVAVRQRGQVVSMVQAVGASMAPRSTLDSSRLP